jgi:uncharacterized protein
MNDLLQRIANIDWQAVTEILDEKGYTAVSQFLPIQSCNELIAEYDNSNLYRKTITMEKYRFGLGEYKYFKYPLPEIIQILRHEIYPKLSPIANTWNKMLNMKTEFPDRFDELKTLP